ncbi:MAG TPA: Rv3235 family protein, partial [Yinghuangia sp.]|nr:Rv3235 family protein [Yinghuangia sp.]
MVQHSTEPADAADTRTAPAERGDAARSKRPGETGRTAHGLRRPSEVSHSTDRPRPATGGGSDRRGTRTGNHHSGRPDPSANHEHTITGNGMPALTDDRAAGEGRAPLGGRRDGEPVSADGVPTGGSPHATALGRGAPGPWSSSTSTASAISPVHRPTWDAPAQPAHDAARATVARLELVRPPAGVTETTGTEEIVAGEPLPPLRVLRAPRCEPDDEPESGPPGATVIPFPTRPPAMEPPYLRLVGAPAPATPREPDPAEARRQVHRFAVALTEVLSGARPLHQLGERVPHEVRGRIARLQRELGARGVVGVSLVASNATAPTDDT